MRKALLALAATAAGAAFGTPATAQAFTCHQTASPTGTITTAQGLVNALAPGQTGCFRAGTYIGDVKVDRSVTLTSWGGEAATVQGRMWIAANGVVVEKLMLDGRNATNLPSPTINATDVVLRDNDISNGRTAICVNTTIYNGSPSPVRFLFERNRIHDCGGAAPNHDHGIYVAQGGGTIRDNVIYDNADRGIQLYPNAQSVQISNNTVDGNGQGIIFGDASANNVVANNVFSNSKIRWNVEQHNLYGTGNAVRDNCVFASNADPYYNQRGGVMIGIESSLALGTNPIADPQYTSRATKDFRINNATCSGKGASSAVAGLAPDTVIDGGPTGSTSATTATFSFYSTKPGSTFECRFDGPGTTVGTWTACTPTRTHSGLAAGTYTFNVRARAYGTTDPTPATRSFTVTTPVTCHQTATPGGAISTVAQMIAALSPGQTGCFRTGSYGAETVNTDVRKANITLRNYPGEVATITGRWVIWDDAPGVRLEGLRLNVKNSTNGVGLVIIGDDVVVRGNDITNNDALSICVHPNANGSAVPDRFVIERNRIHDCGGVSDNHRHGIYVAHGNGAIRENVIFDNADRGIQLYPNAQSVQITNNTIDGNGEGVLFSENSANNLAANNVVTNSILRWNFERYNLLGTGNAIRDNCVFASNANTYYNARGGVETGIENSLTLGTNPVADPQYTNRAAKDFRVNNPTCAGKGAPAAVAQP